ncbi:MAG: type III pantothenate kinase [Planctomycetales bacterium]|nr:type III pantothenate kinase [Planctomycetales bacterium]
MSDQPITQAMPLIAIDIGNTAIKAAAYSPQATRDGSVAAPEQSDGADGARGEILRLPVTTSDFSPLMSLAMGEAVRWWIASVHRPAAQRLADWLRKHRPADEVHLVTFGDVPIVASVRFPERVGIDRLLSAAAANQLRAPARPAIVVDAGSAVTVDAVDADGTFLGGAIFPGASLMAKSLAVHTDQLPLIATEIVNAPSSIGKATDEAIAAGVCWALLGGIREIVERTSQSLSPTPELFLTGGDAVWLNEHLAGDYRYVPDLVLRGVLHAARRADQPA